MSEIYASLQVSPKKKRCPPVDTDDSMTFTPKKLRRLAPPTPPPTVSRRATKIPTAVSELPDHLARLDRIHTALQHALSHALATCAVSPTSDTGIVRNVLNHLSLSTYAGLTTQFEVDDLRRLCWVWEWDGESVKEKQNNPSVAATSAPSLDTEDNPFLITTSPPSPGSGNASSSTSSVEWTRGGMGLVLSPTTHHSKRDRKRVPAYGIGIEVEMDIDKDMGGGMKAVARWTADSETRRIAFGGKLRKWVELHPEETSIPNIPLADLPPLAIPTKISSLTRTLASASPKGAQAFASLGTTLPQAPSSPSRSPTKRSIALNATNAAINATTPAKSTATPMRDFAVPFPISKSPVKSSVQFPTIATKSPTKSSSALLFPQTPSRHHNNPETTADLFSPRTPVTSLISTSASPSKATDVSNPQTPQHQKGKNASTVPQTPTSSRRQALYERVRQKSLNMSPTKTPSGDIPGGKLTKEQMAKMGQEEMRRRCLLGRLGGVAESVWMLFSTPTAGSSSTPTARKRRALPTAEVVTAVIKSSPVPMSTAEANESLSMLTKLCPFFIKELDVGGKEWLEMPAANPIVDGDVNVEATPSKKRLPKLPPSPGPAVKGKHESAEELVTRSPRRVKREMGGLREVREIIRRELELQD
ncbi:hypothetical protein H0H93_008357 [Arthromyces matolae]|nr:hypothetical protein H0H93_008357 [Arthromyces matolae]